jgi:hypothetical protein
MLLLEAAFKDIEVVFRDSFPSAFDRAPMGPWPPLNSAVQARTSASTVPPSISVSSVQHK